MFSFHVKTCFPPLFSQSGCLFDAQSLARKALCGQNPMWRLALRPGGRKKHDFYSFMGSKKWLCTPPTMVVWWHFQITSCIDLTPVPLEQVVGPRDGLPTWIAEIVVQRGHANEALVPWLRLYGEKWNCGDVVFFRKGCRVGKIKR